MSDVHNEISGTVFGPVLQVGRVDSLTVVRPAAPVTPASLPVDAGFVGRAAELAELGDFLAPGGERTASAVVGLPGVGKTALVIRAAHLAVGAGWFPGGVLFVDAQGYNDEQRLAADGALASLLRALGVPGEAIPPGQADREALYRSQLAARPPVLVVVDNASSTDQVLPLRPAGQAHRLVLTSRDNLPVPGARRIELDVLTAAEAVAVLEDAVRAVDPGDDRITADPGAAGALAESCGFLPLALRIVAEVVADRRGEDLTRFAEAITAAHDRLGELAFDDSVDVRTAFNASYGRLPADQARMFRLAALHPGRTVTVATAAALTGAAPVDARALLVRLRRAHLVQGGVVADEYRFHDLLRIYAAERCAAVDDEQTRHAAERALVRHYASHVKGVHSHLDPAAAEPVVFADRLEALAWFDGELDNLLPVLELAARHGWHEDVRDVGHASFRYFDLRRSAEWVPVDELALASARALGDQAGEGRILNGLGSAHHRLRRFDEALACFQAALELFRVSGSLRDQAHSLNNIASTYAMTGRVDEAIRSVEQSARAYRGAGDLDGEARCLANLGKVHNDSGEHARSIEYYRGALDLRRRVGDRNGEGACLNGLGVACDRLGRSDEAEGHYRDALAVYRATGDRHSEGQVLDNLGGTLRETGRFDEALRCHQRSLEICQEIGDAHGEGFALYNLGLALGALGRAEEAADHLRRAVGRAEGTDNRAIAESARGALLRIEAERPAGRKRFRGWRRGRR
ncbi:ATP-binding protein [Saccharothrix texasensis]|uniref:Tetratricopeptide (TPR) repeat protein n=1 Tax=Saccharothrix texasensis TaxID=103734 RepID=A0A3N1H5Z5_9PSEU|nr:tetratricopeptide repeat protein [Saccharothrix texasensis]ROP37929.1 tetratricopeptide (TPR) repeat protein [Saccharothrix texasensis]